MMDKSKRQKPSEKNAFVNFEELKKRKGEIAEFDLDEDSFDRPPLPQPGVYKVKVTWQDKEEGVIEEKFRLDEDGEPTDEFIGYKLYLQVTLLSGDYKGTTIPLWVNTYTNRNRKNSTAVTLLQKAGVEVKRKMSHARVVELIRDAINRGMIVWVKVGWRGSYRKEDGSYVNVIGNENGFDRKDGVFLSTKQMKIEGDWKTIEAQSQIEKVYSANPDLEGNEDEENEVDKVKRKPVKRLVNDDDEEDERDDELEDDEDEEDED